MEASFLWNIIFFKSLQEMKTLHNNEGQEIDTMLSRDVGGGGRDILSSCRGGGEYQTSSETSNLDWNLTTPLFFGCHRTPINLHLTLYLPWVTKREFLLTISIQYQV